MRCLPTFVLLAAASSVSAQIADSWVVPSAFASKDAASTSSFPFTYTNYVRYMQAIDKATMGAPRLIEGLAVRPRAWGSGQLKAFTMQIEVRISLCAKAVNALDGTYANNVKGSQVVVYKGPLHFPVPTGNSPAEFSTTIWFQQPYLYPGTDPILLDFIPLDPCAGGGDSRGCDFDRTSTGMGSVLGKNKQTGCGTPTSGGSSSQGGFVIKFFGATLMPYGLGCKGSNGKYPVIARSGGAPTLGNAAFKYELADARATTGAVLFVGLSRDTVFSTVPLPLDLTIASMPSCFLWSDIAIIGSTATTPLGTAALPFPIPNFPALKDIPLFAQWLVVDAGVNPASLVASSGGAVVLR